MNSKIKTAFAVIVLMATVSFVAVPALSAEDAETSAVVSPIEIPIKHGSANWIYFTGAVFTSVSQTSGPVTVTPVVDPTFGDMITCTFNERGTYTFDIASSGSVSAVSVVVYDHKDSAEGLLNYLVYPQTAVITSGDSVEWTLGVHPSVSITSIDETSGNNIDLSGHSATGVTLDLPVGIHTFKVTGTYAGDTIVCSATVTVTKACDHSGLFNSITGSIDLNSAVVIGTTGSDYKLVISAMSGVEITPDGSVSFTHAGQYTFSVSATCSCGQTVTHDYYGVVVTAPAVDPVPETPVVPIEPSVPEQPLVPIIPSVPDAPISGTAPPMNGLGITAL